MILLFLFLMSLAKGLSIIFIIIILNYFSCSLPISSFIWTSVFKFVTSFYRVSLCFHYYYFFLTYCVWGLLSRASRLNSFFLLVFDLLWLVLWFVSAWYRVIFVLSFLCFFVLFCFVFPLMGKAEWSGNPVCWWFTLYFCFVFFV